MNLNLFREEVAKIQHEIWSHWMKYLFSQSTPNGDGTYTIPVENANHWLQQLDTPFDLLSEIEKESDREQADIIISKLQF